MKMRSTKRRNLLLMLVGFSMIVCAFILVHHNLNEAANAAIASQAAVIQLKSAPSYDEQPTQTPAPIAEEQPDLSNQKMPVKIIDGEEYIGILNIPALDLSLPVISQWNLPALKKAPCRYEGSVYTGDLILCAHNYDQHFGRLQQVKAGDRIEFEDMNGNLFIYQAVQFEQLGKKQVNEMHQGDWDLTLFTCVKGGQKRHTVRCSLVDAIEAN